MYACDNSKPQGLEKEHLRLDHIYIYRERERERERERGREGEREISFRFDSIRFVSIRGREQRERLASKWPACGRRGTWWWRPHLGNILYTIYYIMYTSSSIIYYTLYTMHDSLYTIHYTLYTIHYTLYTIQSYSILYCTTLYMVVAPSPGQAEW